MLFYFFFYHCDSKNVYVSVWSSVWRHKLPLVDVMFCWAEIWLTGSDGEVGHIWGGALFLSLNCIVHVCTFLLFILWECCLCREFATKQIILLIKCLNEIFEYYLFHNTNFVTVVITLHFGLFFLYWIDLENEEARVICFKTVSFNILFGVGGDADIEKDGITGGETNLTMVLQHILQITVLFNIFLAKSKTLPDDRCSAVGTKFPVSIFNYSLWNS